MAETGSDAERPFAVLRVVLENGERLPCLVDSATWLPVRVGTRWAVRHRRYRVQSSTLVSNLRVLCRLYVWAKQAGGFDLDDFLTAGKVLGSRQIESLASDLRSNSDGAPADTGAFDHRLSVIEDFLRWSLDSANRGGDHPLTIARLSAERGRLHDIFRSLRIGGRPANRIQPLEEHQVKAIRAAIGPQGSPTAWTFPEAFAPHARLRNWLMFELALELGIRRGELLKLRLDSLPRGANDGVLILRRPERFSATGAGRENRGTCSSSFTLSLSGHSGVPDLSATTRQSVRQEPVSVRCAIR